MSVVLSRAVSFATIFLHRGRFGGRAQVEQIARIVMRGRRRPDGTNVITPGLVQASAVA